MIKFWTSDPKVRGSNDADTVGLLSKALNPSCSRDAVPWLTLGSGMQKSEISLWGLIKVRKKRKWCGHLLQILQM